MKMKCVCGNERKRSQEDIKSHCRKVLLFFLTLHILCASFIFFLCKDGLADIIDPNKPQPFYAIRIFYNKDINLIRLDQDDKIGPAVDILYGGCIGGVPKISARPLPAPGKADDHPIGQRGVPKKSLYYARVVSFGGKVLLDKYNIGDIQAVITTSYPRGYKGDIADPFPRSGRVNVCVPYFRNGKLVEIYDANKNKLKLSIDVSTYAEEIIEQTELPSLVNVHIFYYPWYGNPINDLGKPGTNSDAWAHWQQNKHNPPDDISSNYYPKLGPYSSNDLAVIDQHMAWMAQAGVGVVVVSWWGQYHFTDCAVPRILNKARAHGLKVAFMIEPERYRVSDRYTAYKDRCLQEPETIPRTAKNIIDDIKYILDKYGNHPAFLKVSRPTRYGPSTAERGVFYIYTSTAVPAAEWKSFLDKNSKDTIRGGPFDAILLGQGVAVKADDYADYITKTHFDGMFSYDVLKVNGDTFASIGTRLAKMNAIFAPSVGPGYIDTRAVVKSAGVMPRYDKKTYRYDQMWERAINSNAEWITITSFNEWHEGTQIEPAIPKSVKGFPYLNYEGHYGKTGKDAEMAYIDRTRYWVNKWLKKTGDAKVKQPTVMGMFFRGESDKAYIVPLVMHEDGKYKSVFVGSWNDREANSVKQSLKGVNRFSLYFHGNLIGTFDVSGFENLGNNQGALTGKFHWQTKPPEGTSVDRIIALNRPIPQPFWLKGLGPEQTSSLDQILNETLMRAPGILAEKLRQSGIRYKGTQRFTGTTPKERIIDVMDINLDSQPEVYATVTWDGEPCSYTKTSILATWKKNNWTVLRRSTYMAECGPTDGSYWSPTSGNVWFETAGDNDFKVSAIDIDGDGIAELIVNEGRWENWRHILYQIRDDRLIKILDIGGYGL